MDESERSQIKRWVETWRKAGPALAAIEREELRAMTDAERRRAIEAVLSLAPVCRRRDCVSPVRRTRLEADRGRIDFAVRSYGQF